MKKAILIMLILALTLCGCNDSSESQSGNEGGSLPEVEEILGPGTEMSQIISDDESITYTWSNTTVVGSPLF